ncbi:MAG: hypothetical protein DRN12_04300 [Thermoplasmata archaeon]|nr:MAG: hypothetical protein DRN12_04300 [Thermoplasmata archaeon]
MSQSLIDLGSIAESIRKELKTSDKPVSDKKIQRDYILTGIPGFDKLLDQGIPVGSNILVSGSAGSGKTIFCLQLLVYNASQGKNCLFISFEEPEDKLIDHMRTFGWNPDPLIESGKLKIKRYLTTDIYYEGERSSTGIKAMMARNSDHLLLDLEPFIIGDEGYKPDIAVVDSLTAVASTFVGKDRGYRFYVERLFRFFEKIGSTNFLITQPTKPPEKQTESTVEDFLSDGVILLYNVRQGNIRESAIEILKMRGVKHEKKIVAMRITDNGIVVYPEQEVFTDI